MLDAVLQILPLILIFLIGFGLKKAKFLASDDGSTLLKLIFYAGLPALFFVSITNIQVDALLILLSLLVPTVVGVSLLTLFLLRKSVLSKIDIKSFGALLVGVVIMNTGFLLPFVEAAYGAEGVARLAIIDAANALITFSIVYAIAARLGSGKPDNSFIVKKLLISPPLWAIVIAIILKTSNIDPPGMIMDTFETIARLVGPVILIALGLKFTLKIKNARLLAVPLLLRFGLGAIIGFAFVKLTGLEGLNAQIIMFASIAPIGFNSITFSELENLDTEFAASQVSIALIIALIIAPFAIHLLTIL